MSGSRTATWLAALVLALLGTGALFCDTKLLERSFLGKPLPEISSEGGTWLNSERAVTLEGLRGRPVLVLFTVLW